MASEFYIGIMVGTSLDGVDYSLIEVDSKTQEIRSLKDVSQPLCPSLCKQLSAISINQTGVLPDLWAIDVKLSEHFAEGVKLLLEQAKISAEQVVAIGCHGVTVRHHPELKFSKQLVCGSTLAHLTAIDVVCDFRMADVAAGGQGAPLVPKFHRLLFKSQNNAALLNLGGIANVTILPAENESLIGFDTGPANTLLNHWCLQHLDKSYDENGEWGASGRFNSELLESLLSEPYFAKPAPKSTGKELFNLTWLDKKLADFKVMEPKDVQATLHHLSARTVADQVNRYEGLQKVFVCGGGAHNGFLMRLLREYCPTVEVLSVTELGHDPDYIEAMAFAWLAFCRIHGVVANDVSVTGAQAEKVLGAWYHK